MKSRGNRRSTSAAANRSAKRQRRPKGASRYIISPGKFSAVRAWLRYYKELPTTFQWDRLLMEEALRRTDGNKTRGAAIVGLTREGFRKKLLRMDVE